MTEKKRIVGAGLGGLIGRPLAERLSKNYDVVRLVRSTSKKSGFPARERVWDPVGGGWEEELDGAHAVVNLAGATVAQRWTPAKKKEIAESRLRTTKALVEAIGRVRNKPRVLVNASAIGYYGDRGATPLTEDDRPGSGFLPDLCREWERQARKAESYGTRVVLLRTGVVLAREGGALAKMLTPFRLGLGGPLGSGEQYLSWIHLEDELNAVEWAIENDAATGPYNLTAPQPETMKDFAAKLGKALHRPALLPAPAFALKLAFGEMSSVLLDSQKVAPSRLQKAGFQHRFPALDDALRDLLTS